MTALPIAQNPYVIYWPEPPHLRLIGHLSAAEPCFIELRDGTDVRGDLVHFTARDDGLVIAPQGTNEDPRRIPLELIRQITLTRPIPATSLDSNAGTDTNQGDGFSEVQVYNIEFFDGAILSGETVGYVRLPAGICLYFDAGQHALTRTFIPDSAIAFWQIGDPIGKLLVEENVVSEDQLKEAVEKQQALRKLVLGDYLIEQNLITPEQLTAALDHQRTRPSLRLGEALIELGFLTDEELETVLSRQRANRGRPLGQILVDMGMLDPVTLKMIHAKKLGQPFVSLKGATVQADAARLIPSRVARRYGVVPLSIEDDSLIIAAEGALNPDVIRELGKTARIRIVPIMAQGLEIRALQDKCYGEVEDPEVFDPSAIRFESIGDVEEIQALPAGDGLGDLFAGNGSRLEFPGEPTTPSERVMLQAIEHLLSAAVSGGTLDIHIETRGDSRTTHISYRKE